MADAAASQGRGRTARGYRPLGWRPAGYLRGVRDVRDFLGGMLLVIGGAGGMRGTTPASDPLFALALMAMLVGPSATGPC